jgi:hypothetical protein
MFGGGCGLLPGVPPPRLMPGGKLTSSLVLALMLIAPIVSEGAVEAGEAMPTSFKM